MKTPSDQEKPLKREYDDSFVVTPEYRASLPDVQNSGDSEMEGAKVPILQVGISGFKLPLRFVGPDGENLAVETKITGTVSLDADKKGINMSRIIRIFYEYKDEVFSPEILAEILTQYKIKLDSKEARIKADFSYPMIQRSLRSGLEGYQYYGCSFEGLIDRADRVRKIIHFDFVYSSACPCASELSEHARQTRDLLAIPHSQRSKARVSVEVHPDRELSLLELRDMCIQALTTETQVMVRREDEQAFAEMNGAEVKFVEDAARLLYAQLSDDSRIIDFRVVCSHFESLHSHDAVAVLCRGIDGGFRAEYEDFSNLII
ncbi:MAG: GTP cyclohydrolase FolE2 [Verrucomicrobiota bacterium]|nr:GTP cyclohydrolase FolE2 [Verrucomicrobiota bacterium]